jgi:hypothetical protein
MASHGFVVMTINTNSTLDQPPSRATQLMAALRRTAATRRSAAIQWRTRLESPATEEAALAELDGLHALRTAHFGTVIARALYGEEEAVTRQLIELLRLEKDQCLTLEEKAERAQQLDNRPR